MENLEFNNMDIGKYTIEIYTDKRIYDSIKRIMDIIISLIGIVFTMPIIIVFGILIKLEDRGPIFYKQIRLGINEEKFTIYKLRSMHVNAERYTGIKWADKNDSRITKVGSIIRKTRIDELPQLINILKGDMSIIGPRPERPELSYEFDNEIPGFLLRVNIKPGLTGLAQINGGYDISPLEKLKWDMEYIRKRNLILDVIIILKTIKVIITGSGAR